jgi:hypothetical protein
VTEAADRAMRCLWHMRRERTLLGADPDRLAALRGKRLGVCAGCGEHILFEDNFTRFGGCVAHVRCVISGRTPWPMSPPAKTELATAEW